MGIFILVVAENRNLAVNNVQKDATLYHIREKDLCQRRPKPISLTQEKPTKKNLREILNSGGTADFFRIVERVIVYFEYFR